MPNREQKAKVIDSLQDTFGKSNAGVFADYRGLTTRELVALRRKLKGSGITFRVVKNTLARFGAEKAGKGALSSAFEGPIAIAFGHGEETQPARVMTEHIAITKLGLNIRGGFLGNKLLTAKEVAVLATLPSRNVLLSRVLGGMQLPLYATLNQLNAPLRGFMTILQAKIKQLEGK